MVKSVEFNIIMVKSVEFNITMVKSHYAMIYTIKEDIVIYSAMICTGLGQEQKSGEVY